MDATSIAAESSSDAARGFNADLFNERMTDKGYTTYAAQAAAIGIHRATLVRWRLPGATVAPGLDKATEIADFLGVTIDELFPRHATIPQQRGAA